MKTFINHLEESCNCWKGYKRKPGTAPCAEGSCIKESNRGLWDNIHAKQKRIKTGSGEHMRKPGSKGAPTDAALKASQTNEGSDWAKQAATAIAMKKAGKKPKNEEFSEHIEKVKGGYEVESEHGNKNLGKSTTLAGAKKRLKQVEYFKHMGEDVEAQFDLIESVVEELALIHNIDPEVLWERFEEFTDEQLLEYAVDAKGHKSSTGGLTQKGRDAYNAHGAHLQAPVTTPPSKLKAGSKAANRRKSFCARMGGMEGPMKKPNGKPTRKALALRKWNC
jgi:Domain of unknown function (DUF6321)